MEPKISRKQAKQSGVFLTIAIIINLISIMVMNTAFMICALILIFIAAYIWDKTNRCPHCGTHFRGSFAAEPNAGYCRKCGKLMEYDEEP